MKVIHIFHVFTKLSTLKRSGFGAISALKRSGICAETLRLTIYTYMYLYKRTYSSQLQVVDNFFDKLFFNGKKEKIISLLLISSLLISCQKIIHSQPINRLGVIERPAAMTHPAQFYLCGNAEYPCSVTSYRHAAPLHHSPISHHQQKRKAHEKSTAKQTCVFK